MTARDLTPIAVTGATGALGSLVARRLSRLGKHQRFVVRDPARAPRVDFSSTARASGYADRAAMQRALHGLHTLFLVSGRESATRIDDHTAAIDAAVAAGIERIVYTSFVGAAPDATFTLARDHAATEAYIRGTGLAFTFLRNQLYLDVVPSLASAQLGMIAGPAGTGKLAAVARADAAECAATVLMNAPEHDGKTYTLTGPEAFTLAEAATLLSRAAGRTIGYRDETRAEAEASRAPLGAPAFEVEGWITSYEAIANGDLATVTDDVPALLGRRAASLREYLAAHPESYAHLH
jgi:uncharacterized protein YbjT (DUF2867 family)